MVAYLYNHHLNKLQASSKKFENFSLRIKQKNARLSINRFRYERKNVLQHPQQQHKCLILKQFLTLVMTLLIATSVFAFGGGRGRKATEYNRGVDSIGVYYGGNQQADVKFTCDDSNATPDIHGVCICNEGYIKDEKGICIINKCTDLIFNDCKTCDPATGNITAKEYGTSCQNDLGTCQSGYCCSEDKTCTTDDNSELYCVHTDEQGRCSGWAVCQEGRSSKDWIVGIPYAEGDCTTDDYPELYCSYTDEQGQCGHWAVCQEGQSSKDWIVGKPNAYGACGGDDYPELYCAYTDDQGQCIGWDFCREGRSTGTSIIGTPNATGACGWADDLELYCKTTDHQGRCNDWWVCREGQSTKESIIGTPNATGTCCQKGYQLENGECVTDACANFVATSCITACSSAGGVATYTYATGTTCANDGTCNSFGICVCNNNDALEDDDILENYCPKNKPVLAANGTCKACPKENENLRYSAYSANECSRCGSGYIYDNKTCYIETCPEGYFRSHYLGSSKDCQPCSGGWYYHILGGNGPYESDIDDCVATCPNRQKMSDGYSSIACTYPCEDFGQIRDRWGYCKDCDAIDQYWHAGGCNLCPGKNFELTQYDDNCELVSDCPEGTHWGFCCDADTVYVHTKWQAVLSSSTKYSKGVCCPKTRPVWNGSMCVPSPDSCVSKI